MAKYPAKPKRTRFKSLKDAVERLVEWLGRSHGPKQNVNSHGFRVRSGGAGGGGAGAGGDQSGVTGGEAVNTTSGVAGPASSTDNAWPRWDGTDGLTLQDGDWVEDDSGNVTAGGTLDMNANPLVNTDYLGLDLRGGGPSAGSSGHGNIWLADTTGNLTTTYDVGAGDVSVDYKAAIDSKMSSWTLTADSGTNQTVDDGETVDIEGGDGVDTTVGATNKVTVAVDSTVVRTTGDQSIAGAKTLSGILDVGGGLEMAVSLPTSGPTTASVNDVCILASTTSGSWTLTLPTASCDTGTTYIIRNIGSANTLTISPGGGNTIDGSATKSLAILCGCMLVYSGVFGAWYTVVDL